MDKYDEVSAHVVSVIRGAIKPAIPIRMNSSTLDAEMLARVGIAFLVVAVFVAVVGAFPIQISAGYRLALLEVSTLLLGIGGFVVLAGHERIRGLRNST